MLTDCKPRQLAIANLRKELPLPVSDILSTGSALVGLVVLLTLLFRLKKYLRHLAAGKKPERSL